MPARTAECRAPIPGTQRSTARCPCGTGDPQFRTKRREKRVSESRLPPPIPQRPNELWTMDFTPDRLATGERFRSLNTFDVTSRECVGIEAARSFPSDRVTDCIDTRITEHGKPAGLQVDDGTEFTSNHFDACAHDRKIAVQQVAILMEWASA